MSSIPGSGRPPGGGYTTHSSILAWRIPWTEEPGGLQSKGSQRVGHNRGTEHTPCACLVNGVQFWDPPGPKDQTCHLFNLLHRQVDSLPLAPPGKPTLHSRYFTDSFQEHSLGPSSFLLTEHPRLNPEAERSPPCPTSQSAYWIFSIFPLLRAFPTSTHKALSGDK